MRALASCVVLVAAISLSANTIAKSTDEMSSDMVHSDLPLFDSEYGKMWPEPFADGDSFGCSSRVGFGDWAFRDTAADGDSIEEWYRFSNYGAFHCFANVGHAYEREDLEAAHSRPSFFVLLETPPIDGKNIELWAIQIGALPGSEYLLLSRAPDKGIVDRFDVLQTDCPDANVRRAGPMDILRTEYCAINSRAELITFARRMASQPPLGTLTRVDDTGE